MRNEFEYNVLSQSDGSMQFADTSQPVKRSGLFKGISIFVNGLTDPSADQLKCIMKDHGGVFHHYERLHTTHIISANLPDAKCRRSTKKFISAQWVVDCLKEQRLVDHSKYRLNTNLKTGKASACVLKQEKLLTCGDLQQASLGRIQRHFGKNLGETDNQACRGYDNRPWVFDQVRKSVSSKVHFGIRFENYEECEPFVIQLCADVHKRLTDISCRAKYVILKVLLRVQEAPIETSKFMDLGVFDSYSKTFNLPEYTNDLDMITQTVLATMKTMNVIPKELRGLSIKLSKLDRTNNGEVLPAQAGGGKSDQSIAVRKRGPPPKRSAKKKTYGPVLNEIDPKVLAELPEHALNVDKEPVAKKQPVLLNETDCMPSTSKAAAEKLLANRNENSAECSAVEDQFLNHVVVEENLAIVPQPMVSPPAESEALETQGVFKSPSENLFLSKSLIKLMENWVDGQPHPLDCDIDVLTNNACEMVKNHRLDELYNGMICLFRFINMYRGTSEFCSGWHLGYKIIKSAIEWQMRVTYDRKIFIFGNCLNCKKCGR